MSHRTQITLSDAQYDLLRTESARLGVGLAELVRRALDRTYGAAEHAEIIDALDDSFGTWAGGDDGATYVEGLRRGMAGRLAEA